MKSIKKILNCVINISFYFAVWFVCSALFLRIGESILASIERKEINENYAVIEEPYLYKDSDSVLHSIQVDELVEALPEEIKKDIKKNWVIVISENDPTNQYSNDVVSGMAMDKNNLIWLSYRFSEEVVYHEIGHAIGSARSTDLSKDFWKLYESVIEKDITFSQGVVSFHDFSSQKEFFALLFEQYICYPDSLKQDFAEGYEYMHEFVSNYKTDPMNSFTGMFVKCYNFSTSVVRDLFWSASSKINVLFETIFDQRASAATLPSEGDVYPSFSGMSTEDKKVFEVIFDVIQNPKNYTVQNNSKENIVVLKYSPYVTYDIYNRVAACIDYCLGVEQSNIFDVNSLQDENYSCIYIHIDELTEIKEKRKNHSEKMDEVLATIEDGTETQKLLQISRYISENSKYQTMKSASVNEFWTNGNCDSVTYAMVFRDFCEKLGIQCDIIYGSTSNGESHAWNRVKLSDGTYRYYDITYYNKGKVNMYQYQDFIVTKINSY